MDLIKLKYFYAIAKYENISTASKELLVSQSALSKAIRSLEDELNMDLFYRNGKKIVLNDNGHLLFQQANRIFNELDDLNKIMEEQRVYGNGRLSIITTLPYTFTNLITSFIKKSPNTYYEQLALSKKNLDLFIEHGKFDVCLMTEPIIHPNVSWIPLAQEEILIAVPNDYPADTLSKISINALENTPFIGLSNHFAFRQLMNQICEKLNFTPDYHFQLDEPTVVLELVKKGIGAAFMPISSLGLLDESAKYLYLEEQPIQRQIGLVVHNNRYHSTLLKQFITHCHEFFETSSNIKVSS